MRDSVISLRIHIWRLSIRILNSPSWKPLQTDGAKEASETARAENVGVTQASWPCKALQHSLVAGVQKVRAVHQPRCLDERNDIRNDIVD